MNWKSSFSAVLLAVVCLPLFLTSPGTCAGLQYEVVPVAQPSYENRYSATAINENGWICGSSGNGPFVWDGRQMTYIVSAEYDILFIMDINDSGQVVGDAMLNGFCAFLWENGVFRPLEGSVNAAAINNLGQIVGQRSYSQILYLWDGEIKPILTPWECRTGNVYDINDCGQVIGYCSNSDGRYPFVWQNDTIVSLPLPDNVAVRSCTPLAINNRGVIIGNVITADYGFLLIMWELDGSIKIIGEAYITSIWKRLDLNDHGDVVANIVLGERRAVPAIYRNGTWTEIKALLPPDSPWTVVEVCDINNKRQIAATCTHKDSGLSTAALFQPTIIPAVDILPDAENIIKANRQGLIKAAILSDADFDATGIAPETLQIDSLKVTHYKITDTNNDGRDDLLCQFRLSDLNLPLGQHTLVIQGSTSDNTPVRGQDSVLIVK